MNELDALRWVARQWQRLNGKDEISSVEQPPYLQLATSEM